MNKLFKHLPHKRKKRILKKVGGIHYSNYIAYQKLVIKMSKSCGREVALKVRSMPRRRTATNRIGGFGYSSKIVSAFVWHIASEGGEYWCEISDRHNEYLEAKAQDDIDDTKPTE